jgi:hypothetical protein
MERKPDPLPLKAAIIAEFQDRMGWTVDGDNVSVEVTIQMKFKGQKYLLLPKWLLPRSQ